MTVADIPKLRRLGEAYVLPVPAPGMKAAALWRISRIGDIALEQDVL